MAIGWRYERIGEIKICLSEWKNKKTAQRVRVGECKWGERGLTLSLESLSNIYVCAIVFILSLSLTLSLLLLFNFGRKIQIL